jgi:hypothetical protein
MYPTKFPSAFPTLFPTLETEAPTALPSASPTATPTATPTIHPTTAVPTAVPTGVGRMVEASVRLTGYNLGVDAFDEAGGDNAFQQAIALSIGADGHTRLMPSDIQILRKTAARPSYDSQGGLVEGVVVQFRIVLQTGNYVQGEQISYAILHLQNPGAPFVAVFASMISIRPFPSNFALRVTQLPVTIREMHADDDLLRDHHEVVVHVQINVTANVTGQYDSTIAGYEIGPFQTALSIVLNIDPGDLAVRHVESTELDSVAVPLSRRLLDQSSCIDRDDRVFGVYGGTNAAFTNCPAIESLCSQSTARMLCPVVCGVCDKGTFEQMCACSTYAKPYRTFFYPFSNDTILSTASKETMHFPITNLQECQLACSRRPKCLSFQWGLTQPVCILRTAPLSKQLTFPSSSHVIFARQRNTGHITNHTENHTVITAPEQRIVLVQAMVFITAYSLGPEADSVYTIIRRNDFDTLLTTAWANEITQDPFLASVRMQAVRTEDLDSIGQELLPPLPPIPYAPPIIEPSLGVQINGVALAAGLGGGLFVSCILFIFYRRWIMRTRRAKAVEESVGKLTRQKKQERRELLKKSLAEKDGAEKRKKERRDKDQEWLKAERSDKDQGRGRVKAEQRDKDSKDKEPELGANLKPGGRASRVA